MSVTLTIDRFAPIQPVFLKFLLSEQVWIHGKYMDSKLHTLGSLSRANEGEGAEHSEQHCCSFAFLQRFRYRLMFVAECVFSYPIAD